MVSPIINMLQRTFSQEKITVNTKQTDKFAFEDHVIQKANEDRPCPISLLSNEIIQNIFIHCNYKNISKFYRICKKFAYLMNDPVLWKIFFYRHILKKNPQNDICSIRFYEPAQIVYKKLKKLAVNEKHLNPNELTSKRLELIKKLFHKDFSKTTHLLDTIRFEDGTTNQLVMLTCNRYTGFIQASRRHYLSHSIEVSSKENRTTVLYKHILDEIRGQNPIHQPLPILKIQLNKKFAFAVSKNGTILRIDLNDFLLKKPFIVLNEKEFSYEKQIYAAVVGSKDLFLSTGKKLTTLSIEEFDEAKDFYEAKNDIIFLESKENFLFAATDSEVIIWKDSKEFGQHSFTKEKAISALYATTCENITTLYIGHVNGQITALECSEEIRALPSIKTSEKPIEGFEYQNEVLFVFSSQIKRKKTVTTITALFQNIILKNYESKKKLLMKTFIQEGKLLMYTTGGDKFYADYPIILQPNSSSSQDTV